MREVPRGNSKYLPTYLENSLHTHTDPCAHDTQPLESGIDAGHTNQLDDILTNLGLD